MIRKGKGSKPWKLKSHRTGRTIGSYKTKKAAVKALRRAKYFGKKRRG